jgi:phage host-nuclease inhibitor protein Gam
MDNAVQAVDDFEIIEEPAREPFVVDDDSKADWAMRKLASIRRKQSENKAIFDRELQRVSEWLEKVNTALERDAEWFEANLRPYALLQRSEGRKSVVLPHGTIKTTAGRPKFEIENEEQFIAWAETSAPELVRIKKEIDKKALGALNQDADKVISTQGEIVPAVKVVPAEVSISFVIAE